MDKLRRNMLFCPASNEKLLQNAHKKRPDCLVFDLEDSVAFSEKTKARTMLCESVKAVDRGNIEIFVRINALASEFGYEDVRQVVSAGVKNIRLPMCETRQHVLELSDLLEKLESELSISEKVSILCSIETPRGVYNAFEIASACDRVTAISFGAEDYVKALRTSRSKRHEQFLFARSQVAIAANIANVSCFDMVFADFSDQSGFRDEAEMARLLGFSGKTCIHPSQVLIANEVFSPSEQEVSEALKIISCVEDVENNGLGVVSFNGKMIDLPIIERARNTVMLDELIKHRDS